MRGRASANGGLYEGAAHVQSSSRVVLLLRAYGIQNIRGIDFVVVFVRFSVRLAVAMLACVSLNIDVNRRNLCERPRNSL